MDATSSYFQAPRSPCSYKLPGLLTEDATYEFTRCTMGMKNSAGHYSYMMTRILEGTIEPDLHLESQKLAYARIPEHLKNKPRINLLGPGLPGRCCQYLDDTLLHSSTLDGLLNIISLFLERMTLLNIEIKPVKTFCYETSIEWIG